MSVKRGSVKMFDYTINGRLVEVTLDNGKKAKIDKKFLDTSCQNLQIEFDEAIEMWLDDEGYLNNEEQNELDSKAKANKVNKIIMAKNEKPKKTQKERTRKENPTKEMVIKEIAELLPKFATNVNVENVGKIITFTIGDDNFKLDLTQTRKKKSV